MQFYLENNRLGCKSEKKNQNIYLIFKHYQNCYFEIQTVQPSLKQFRNEEVLIVTRLPLGLLINHPRLVRLSPLKDRFGKT